MACTLTLTAPNLGPNTAPCANQQLIIAAVLANTGPTSVTVNSMYSYLAPLSGPGQLPPIGFPVGVSNIVAPGGSLTMMVPFIPFGPNGYGGPSKANDIAGGNYIVGVAASTSDGSNPSATVNINVTILEGIPPSLGNGGAMQFNNALNLVNGLVLGLV